MKRHILIKICKNKGFDIELTNDELEKRGLDFLNAGEKAEFIEKVEQEREEVKKKFETEPHQFEKDPKKREQLKKSELTCWYLPRRKKANISIPTNLWNVIRKKEKNVSRHISYLLAKDLKEREQEEKNSEDSEE